MRLVISRSQFIREQFRDLAEFLLFRGLFLLFRFVLNRAVLRRVLASVCEAKLHLCVREVRPYIEKHL